MSKSVIRRRIMAGVIRVNGRPSTRAGSVLAPGATLDAAIDEGRLPTAAVHGETPGRVPVLYEDEALIAVAKPAGLPTHATADPSRPDLFTLVRRQLGDDPPGAGPTRYLGLHHRLDLDTSGVVLFTKTPSANAGLAAQFEARSIDKVYHALTLRPPGGVRSAWRVQDALAQAGTGRTSRMSRVLGGGQAADTEFRVLERFSHALLVDARPHTGRKHQVRAHLRGEGMPILGDVRYGGPRMLAGLAVARPLLHARRLALAHPLTGARLEIDCEYPEDFLRVLNALRARLDTTTPTR
jgi:RluA family pseudouridine synthase